MSLVYMGGLSPGNVQYINNCLSEGNRFQKHSSYFISAMNNKSVCQKFIAAISPVTGVAVVAVVAGAGAAGASGAFDTLLEAIFLCSYTQ